MPNLTCRCDYRIWYGEIPSPYSWRIISEVAYDAFSGKVDAEEVYRATLPMLKCPNCGRLWIFWNGGQGEVSPYKPE